ncbi:MAG: hypothetical protein Q7S74_06045 [Nanoarchaeota archaeon]|nr:hypothetical protein [Nanoarchaeota archaeon]
MIKALDIGTEYLGVYKLDNPSITIVLYKIASFRRIEAHIIGREEDIKQLEKGLNLV